MSTNELSEKGRLSFEWALSHMPVLTFAEKYIRKKIGKNNPLAGLKVSACLHISKETAVLIHSLHSLGLEIRLVAANPLSSQDDIVSFLSDEGIQVHAHKGETVEEYNNEIVQAAKSRPDLIVDDGGDLHVAYARTRLDSCFGGSDETTSGTIRLRALDKSGKLRYPAIPVNEANTKHLFDNRYGTGQSAVDGLIRATGLLLAGKLVVIAGYGWVGKGVAEKVRGLGSRVVVTEVDPIRSLEAKLDGYQVLQMSDAAKIGDIFLTCTGQIDVINSSHFKLLKDGVILGNVGHFNEEVDTRSLFRMGERVEQVRENVAKIELKALGKTISVYLLNQGRVVNLVSAEGHPPEIMQLSFANQLLSVYHLVTHRKELARKKEKLIPFPPEIDDMVSQFALEGFGLKIDRLSKRQKKYASSFTRGSA
ncbi:MAG TPA: adenosylhomocysteinase [Nitrososphaerales archaeon]|nr:adenosylhomocysteinase [Nitrososphaerales archaeon]